MTTATVLDASGSGFLCSNVIIDAVAASFTVNDNVTGAAGGSYQVFGIVTIFPYVHVPVVATGRLIQSGNTTGKITTTTNIRGRIT